MPVRVAVFMLPSGNIDGVFPVCNHTYRGVDGIELDGIIFTKIRVNEGSTPAAENVAGVESVASTPACVKYTSDDVEET